MRLHYFSQSTTDGRSRQKRGWEPKAILNWLALAGWGAQTEPSEPSTQTTSNWTHKAPPDSTTLMDMEDMIREVMSRLARGVRADLFFQFELSSITPRRTVLDPSKLEYLNKHHLMKEMTTDSGLGSMAERAHAGIKVAFPSRYASDHDNSFARN